MPIGDPRNGFLYPTLTLMMDSYNLRRIDIDMTLPKRYVFNGEDRFFRDKPDFVALVCEQ